MKRWPRLLLLGVLVLFESPAFAAAPNWGWLGVRIRDLSEAEMEDLSIRHGLREGYGVVIVEVLPGTPAAQAGLQNGDLLVAVEGRPMVEVSALQRVVGKSRIGEELTLTLLRGGRRQALKARVGQMPREVLAERVAAEFGFVFRGQGREERATLTGEELVVAGVLPGGVAERAGLRAGDRLVGVDGAEMTGEALREALASHDLERPLRVNVRREGQARSIVLPSPGARATP